MSPRILSCIASASLFLAVGCAAAPQDDDNDNVDPPVAQEQEQEGEENSTKMPSVDMESSVDIQATGYACTCPNGQEMQNGLCYPRCASGYNGEGPVCWQPCASGFRDTGWFCHRDSRVISANTSRCPWYNKCGLGSSCSTCPSGYSNDGCTCRRDAYIYAQPSYGRGAGTTPSCSSN